MKVYVHVYVVTKRVLLMNIKRCLYTVRYTYISNATYMTLPRCVFLLIS